MDAATHSHLHRQLTHRRERIDRALLRAPGADDLVRLLLEVDSALERLDGGVYGMCVICGGSFEAHELDANPLVRWCLCSLSPEQMNHLEKDLQLATQIQQSLLPPQDLEWCGWNAHFRYLPAGPVSGDYCDLVPANSPSEDLWFVIADVSGKGVAAALRMAHLNAAFRTTIASGVEVGELAARMNRMMADTAGSQYASLVAGRARGDGSIELCNAGHPPPLVRRRDGIATVEAGGYPLGLIGSGSYTTESLRLEPGETLLLYTDGITEARNKAGEEYGPERLGSVLLSRENGSPCDLAAACVDDHQLFADAGPAQDDRTLLVLRRAAA